MPRTREQDAKRVREHRETIRAVLIPRCADLRRRRRLEANDAAWLMFYCGEGSGVTAPFWYDFTAQQLKMIAAIRNAILHGGDQAVAASRGEGKTSIFRRMTAKYILQGQIACAVLFAATGPLAADSLAAIKQDIEQSQRLYEDYPEVCEPVRRLENTPNRAHYMTVSGRRHNDRRRRFARVPAKFSWGSGEITIPNVPGSPSAGSIIATRGLDSAIRGLNKLGKRVDLAGIDDPDTEETVNSEDHAEKLEKRIDRGIAGLGSQQRGISRVMLCTIQNRTCVAFKFTDPEQKPTWNGQRFRFLVSPPSRTDLWTEYIERRTKGMQDGDQLGRGAHAFFLQNFDQMTDGAEVANPHRFNGEKLADGSQLEVCALQRYFNLVQRIGQEAVRCEYDNDPPPEEDAARLVLTAYHVRASCRSGADRGVVPADTVAVTVGGDIKKLGLHHITIAWNDQAVGSVIDYDFWPFETQGKKASACEVLILEGLQEWWATRSESPFLQADGTEWQPDLVVVDSAWKEDGWNTQPVYLFCQHAGPDVVVPSRGIGNWRPKRQSPTCSPGDNYNLVWLNGVLVAEVNADHWKIKVHEGFLQDFGDPGSLGLFTPPQDQWGREPTNYHLSYAKHITSERWGPHGASRAWRWAPADGSRHQKPNHWLDATALAIAGRVMWGVQTIKAEPKQPAAVVSDAETEMPATAGFAGDRSW